MAFKMLDSRTMLVTSHEQLPVIPDRPEPPRRQRKALDRSASAKHLKLSEADFSMVCSRSGFPKSIVIPSGIPGVWRDKTGWYDTELERWRDQCLAERDELIRLFPE